jgi:hypothetical protein
MAAEQDAKARDAQIKINMDEDAKRLGNALKRKRMRCGRDG